MYSLSSVGSNRHRCGVVDGRESLHVWFSGAYTILVLLFVPFAGDMHLKVGKIQLWCCLGLILIDTFTDTRPFEALYSIVKRRELSIHVVLVIIVFFPSYFILMVRFFIFRCYLCSCPPRVRASRFRTKGFVPLWLFRSGFTRPI